MRRAFILCVVMCSLSLSAAAQAAPEPEKLVPGRPVEREIAGGESHAYQITLQRGQFVRVVVEQKAIDVTLTLAGPDGKQLAESDLMGIFGGREPLSFEATAAGDYRLAVRANREVPRGAYQVLVELKDAASAQDRKRQNAEQLVHEARRLHNERKYADPQLSEKLGRALGLWRELNDRYWQAATLNLIGLGHLRVDQYDKAIEPFEQALALWRAERFRAGEGQVLRNLGTVYTYLTRLDKAVESYEQALPVFRELKDRQGEALALGPLANVYSQLGRPEKSIEYFEQVLPINREFKNHYRVGNNLNGLGNAYLQLDKGGKAIELYEQALAVAREHKLRDLEGIILGNLGNAHAQPGRYGKAIEYLRQALLIAREGKSLGAELSVLGALGYAFHGLAQYPQALQHHSQALRLARQLRARNREGENLHDLMQDWHALGKPGVAIFYGKQAVNLYQEIRGEITSLDRETRQSYAKSKEDTYRALADLLIGEGRLPEAEQVIGLLKEEEYFDFVRRDSADLPQAGKSQLTPEEQALDKRYREISDQLAELGAERGTLIGKSKRTPEEEQRLAKLDADLAAAGDAFQKFLDRLGAELGPSEAAGGRVYHLRESQGLMEDLRELGAGTVALHTLITEDRYRVILTTPDFQKGYEYPIKAADLNRKVLELRAVLQNPRYDPLPLTQELYRILLGPVAKDLEKAKARTLMWSLDGVLRYVPVSALHDGKRYLAERFDNAVFTPASQARLKDAPARNWDALGLGVSKAHGERIPALPGVVDEMRGIIRDASAANTAAAGNPAGVLPGVVKLDEQFTQEAMLAELRKRHKVVHVASHFQFSPGNETNSALLLGDGTFLSLAQIKSLPNVFGGVELLTLSACNTATGGGANGKEVEGFGVLAQRQGAKAVVASLWPVADRSTKLLMQEFYRAREARAGLTKIAALREAQLKLLRGEIAVEAAESAGRQLTHEDAKPGEARRQVFKPDPKVPFAHPYYWAPFILIGNWK